MDLEKVFVVDIECDGLLDELTKLHVLSVGWKNSDGKWSVKSTNKEEDIEKICYKNVFRVWEAVLAAAKR